MRFIHIIYNRLARPYATVRGSYAVVGAIDCAAESANSFPTSSSTLLSYVADSGAGRSPMAAPFAQIEGLVECLSIAIVDLIHRGSISVFKTLFAFDLGAGAG